MRAACVRPTLAGKPNPKGANHLIIYLPDCHFHEESSPTSSGPTSASRDCLSKAWRQHEPLAHHSTTMPPAADATSSIAALDSRG